MLQPSLRYRLLPRLLIKYSILRDFHRNLNRATMAWTSTRVFYSEMIKAKGSGGEGFNLYIMDTNRFVIAF